MQPEEDEAPARRQPRTDEAAAISQPPAAHAAEEDVHIEEPSFFRNEYTDTHGRTPPVVTRGANLVGQVDAIVRATGRALRAVISGADDLEVINLVAVRAAGTPAEPEPPVQPQAEAAPPPAAESSPWADAGWYGAWQQWGVWRQCAPWTEVPGWAEEPDGHAWGHSAAI